MSERRGHWYLLTGIGIGIALGLLISWVIAPVQYLAASPSSLRPDFKDEYRYMIAASYAATGNLGRARARLALLGDKNTIQALRNQSERMLNNNIAPSVVRNVSALSLALQTDEPSINSQASSAVVVDEDTSTPLPVPVLVTETPISVIETPTLEPAATTEAVTTPLPTSAAFTAIPRLTPTATFTPGAAFIFVKSTPFCDPVQPGLLQISLTDANGQPAAGIELVVTWAGGEEHFFSGLKPELGNGYADFVMSPNVEYALSLSNGTTRVTSLKSSACTAKDGSSSSGGIHLDFKQP
jgi:hypothetical protein